MKGLGRLPGRANALEISRGACEIASAALALCGLPLAEGAC